MTTFWIMANKDNICISNFLRTREGYKFMVTVYKFDHYQDNLYQESSSEIDA